MTIGKLIQQLQRLGTEHGMRTPVCANTRDLRDTCNDTWPVVDISTAHVEYVEQCDADGFSKFNKDGTQSIRKCLVLR